MDNFRKLNFYLIINIIITLLFLQVLLELQVKVSIFACFNGTENYLKYEYIK